MAEREKGTVADCMDLARLSCADAQKRKTESADKKDQTGRQVTGA